VVLLRQGFQAHKIKHALARYGVEYQFERALKDKYGQPILDENGDPVYYPVEGAIKGIFHEAGTDFLLNLSDAATTHSKPQPAILAYWEDGQSLRVNDRVFVPPGSGRQYKVVAVNDVGNLELCADISLEVFEDGLSV
jgi:hypothetical protein